MIRQLTFIIIMLLVITAFSGCRSTENAVQTIPPAATIPVTAPDQTAIPEPTDTPIPEIELFGLTIPADAEKLDLTSVSAADFNAVSLCDALGELKNVALVDLYGVDISGEDKLSLVKKYPQIMFRWQAELCGSVYDSDISEIDIEGQTIEDAGTFSKQLSLFPMLTKINMCDCGLTEEQMEALTKAYPNVKFVWRIVLNDLWSVRTDAIAFSTLKTNETAWCKLNDEQAQLFRFCTDLVALDLGHHHISDLSFLYSLPNLRVLILADNDITDLTPVESLSELTYLEIFTNPLEDLTPLSSLTKLRDLNYCRTSVSDAAPILGLASLERVWMKETKVSEEGYKKVSGGLPDAVIKYYGKGLVDEGWRNCDKYNVMMETFRTDNMSVTDDFKKYFYK